MWTLMGLSPLYSPSIYSRDIATRLFPKPVPNEKIKLRFVDLDLFRIAIPIAAEAYHIAGANSTKSEEE